MPDNDHPPSDVKVESAEKSITPEKENDDKEKLTERLDVKLEPKREDAEKEDCKDVKKEEDEDDMNGEKAKDSKREDKGSSKPNGEIKEKEETKYKFARVARNRVKLYVLCEQRIWDDRGTGHVACLPLNDQSGFHAIVVQLESNGSFSEKNVLESKILMDTVYQKQQETLIVWSESESCDLALSFQEKTGCEEIWSKICEVQGKDPGDVEGGGDDEDGELSDCGGGGSGGASSSGGLGKAVCNLPPVEMGSINEIEFFLNNNTNSLLQRERVAAAIEKESYISKLCDQFKKCEDLEHEKGLRALANIARLLFMLNKNCVIEQLVDDKNLREVIGMLEYDASGEEKRQKPHREFLFEKAKFRQILPMENELLKEKIHHVYRVQYLQDVCLPAPSLFEENHLSALNSYLFFNRVDIVAMVQEDRALLRELFSNLKDPKTEVSRRRDLALFLKELCSMSNSLQQNGPQSKEAFYKTLVQSDVMAAIEPCMLSPDGDTKAAITEMLHSVVEFSPQNVRDFLIKQARDKKDCEILLNLLLDHIVTDRDSELTSAGIMLQVMRLILDPDNMAQKGEKNEFLTLFYYKCLPSFTDSLVRNVTGVTKPKHDDYHTAKQLSLVLRLLNFCVSNHAPQMRNFVIRQDFLNKALVLLNSKHHFLALYALKLLRTVVQQKDEWYYKYMCDRNVLDKVVLCFMDNGKRNNLLNSAIIEIFEYIKTEDMKMMVCHVVERHIESLLTHDYVATFKDLKLRYEQQKDREELMRRTKEDGPEREKDSRWRKEKESERDESWFDNDDEEEEEEDEEGKKGTTSAKTAPASGPGRKSGAEPMFPSRRDQEEDSGVFGGSGPVHKLGPIAISPRFTIKTPSQVDGARSRSPSPGSVPREDEVSSSQTAATSPSASGVKRSASSSPSSSPAPKKSLVEYDDSDSDSDGDTSEGPSREDSVPSSSTGSPSSEDSTPVPRRDSPLDNGDVSSTSGEDEELNGSPRTDGPSISVNSESPATKKEGDDSPISCTKKRRLEEQAPSVSPRPSPPPVDPVAQ